VVGNDDRGYGIPYAAIRIVKYNPADPDTTCTLGEESEEEFDCGIESLDKRWRKNDECKK